VLNEAHLAENEVLERIVLSVVASEASALTGCVKTFSKIRHPPFWQQTSSTQIRVVASNDQVYILA